MTGRLIRGRVHAVVRRGPGRNRVSRHDVPSLTPGLSEEIFRGLVRHEEQPVLLGLMIRDDKHPVMLGTPGFFDHKPPVQLGVLEKLPPVVSRPARRFATP